MKPYMTKQQKNCDHSTRNSEYIIDYDENPYTGKQIDNSRWEHTKSNTFIDISISQYKCTQCGLVFNYSGGNLHHISKKKYKKLKRKKNG